MNDINTGPILTGQQRTSEGTYSTTPAIDQVTDTHQLYIRHKHLEQRLIYNQLLSQNHKNPIKDRQSRMALIVAQHPIVL